MSILSFGSASLKAQRNKIQAAEMKHFRRIKDVVTKRGKVRNDIRYELNAEPVSKILKNNN